MTKIKSKILHVAFNGYIFLLERAYKKLTLDKKKAVLRQILKSLERYDEDFLSLRRLPKFAKGFCDRHYFANTRGGDYAIIIRGLLVSEENFTLETIRIYKKIFPQVKIIIASWDRPEYRDLYKELENLGCRVLKLAEPDNIGVSHINGQLTQIKKGIDEAERLKCKYIIIQRSDHRINYPYTIEYLTSLLEAFPVGDNNPFNQSSRIISVCCFQDRVFELPPYFLRDLFHFGEVYDLKSFFDVPFTNLTQKDYWEALKKSGKDRLTVLEESELNFAPESLYVKNYIHSVEKIGVKYEDNYSDWWGLLKNCFLTISPKDIDLYGIKHDIKYILSAPSVQINNSTYETRNYDFRKWINIYSDRFEADQSNFEIEDEFQRYWSGLI